MHLGSINGCTVSYEDCVALHEDKPLLTILLFVVKLSRLYLTMPVLTELVLVPTFGLCYLV